ncbi:MAG: radical SAM protein [Methanoregulaceae archaeon]|jgi:7-carboxy-7-deazaguanine synthase|nr:radical SAM protein [Methanoregulaceae archaeon]
MKLVEIFKSLQGEGKSQGKPTVFIRLSGCNLNCSWCDTPHSHNEGQEYSNDEIIRVVGESGCKEVCITGGEPLLQLPELRVLLSRLSRIGYTIEIETNGTVDFGPVQDNATICMDVKCPSSGEQSDLGLLKKITSGDSVKFVVGNQEDCRYAEDVIKDHPIRGEIFFSPVAGSDYHEIACYVLDNNLPVRFQVQLHKIIGVR